jgi:hypothetical protein
MSRQSSAALQQPLQPWREHAAAFAALLGPCPLAAVVAVVLVAVVLVATAVVVAAAAAAAQHTVSMHWSS